MSPNSNNKTFFKQLLNYCLYMKTCAVIKPGLPGFCSLFNIINRIMLIIQHLFMKNHTWNKQTSNIHIFWMCSSFVCRTSMVSLIISSDGCYAIKVSVTAVCRLLVYSKFSDLYELRLTRLYNSNNTLN